MWKIGLIALAILSLTAISAQGNSSPKAGEATKPPEVQVRGPIVATAVMVDFDEEYAKEQELLAYYAEVQRQIDDYLSIQNYFNLLEEAKAAAARQRVTAVSTTTIRITGNSGVTGACGGATNGADQFISRESGGNPGVYNTGGSGAWGCYQIMPATWSSSCGPNSKLGPITEADGSVANHGSASPSAQAACASRLPMSAWGG